MKPTIKLKPGESPSAAILRLHKHIRRMNRGYEPGSQYASRVNMQRAKLRVVK